MADHSSQLFTTLHSIELVIIDDRTVVYKLPVGNSKTEVAATSRRVAEWMLIVGGCQKRGVSSAVCLTLSEDRATIHLYLRKRLLQLALLGNGNVGKLINVHQKIMGERHFRIKLVAEVDVVEEILAKFLGQQSDGEGTFSATLLSDKHRYGFISVQHVHLQPMGYCRTEPGGAPAKLFAGQPRNSAEKSSHMVLAIPFRQLVHVFLDRVEDGNGIRLDILLDVLSWRLLLADSQFLGAANDGG